jgi:hypothetical protein
VQKYWQQQATANALGQIAGFLEQQGEEGVVAAKAFAVAELAINTAVAISTAIAGATAAAASKVDLQHHSCK